MSNFSSSFAIQLMMCGWEAWKDALQHPASNCNHAQSHSLTEPVHCWSHISLTPLRDQLLQSGKKAKKVKPNHQDTRQSGTWECRGRPSCSVPPPSFSTSLHRGVGEARLEEQVGDVMRQTPSSTTV